MRQAVVGLGPRLLRIGRRLQRLPDGAPVHYGRHRPEQITLNRLVQQHAATFLAPTEVATGAGMRQPRRTGPTRSWSASGPRLAEIATALSRTQTNPGSGEAPYRAACQIPYG
jgi:hypothetical protein